ncbi:pentapeptide repeat-containing protein [Streptomyces hydrogenans]|uniref:pentapeptide repeat-containing protein n=1 Tax=Streptomyces hydrogenans TaxID=1873719 RepID=UPI0035DAF084
MSTPPPSTPSTEAPSWPHCAHGADPVTDPVGCRGIHVPGHTACLAHLNDTDRTAYLTGLAPGADIDHRATPFTEDLLNQLLTALTDPTAQHPHFGDAVFREARFSGYTVFSEARFSGDADFFLAQFSGDAVFQWAQFSGAVNFLMAEFSGDADFFMAQLSGNAVFRQAQFSDNAKFSRAQFSGAVDFLMAEFSGDADFVRARFSGDAVFRRARFSGDAVFSRAQFSGDADFLRAQFSGDAVFRGAQFSGNADFFRAPFSGDAVFRGAEFSGDAVFREAQFSGAADFLRAQFSGDAVFRGAQFLTSAYWGPLVCAGRVDLSGAVFGAPVTLEIAARELSCVRTRWESTATIRVRRAVVDLSYVVLAAPVSVNAHPAPFTTVPSGILDESLLTGPDRVRVTSVQGVDAAHLVLTDTDLSDCLFSGAFHLDQLRLEGRTTLAPTPTGFHRRGIAPIHWTRRRTLAEEHHWRAQRAGQPPAPAGAVPEPRRWRTGPHHPDPARTPDPDDVAALYRQLRKAFEDGKNEPGAADFYYGECEMRRHDRTGTPKSERRLLWAYWLLSGYGLRASRALGWLAAAMLTTILLLMAFGLPVSSPKQEATGTVPAGGGKVTFVIDKQDPKNPVKDRFTSKRFDKALSVTLNSVVFRSSGQDLTTTGTYIEMTSRILEPALLALAVLAIRGRIKR